jgi:DNA-binding GntR family transcriptional regulator
MAYERVRELIASGELRPNQRLVETDLAAALGISRTPVRDGLLRLAAEGLARREKHGWTVQEYSAVEIRELYEVRAPLEGYAAYLAAKRALPSDIKAMRRALQTAAKASADQSSDLDRAFHITVIQASRSARLISEIERNRGFYFDQRIAGLHQGDQTLHPNEEHAALVEAISDRDPDRAEKIARQHLLGSLDAILARLN